LILGVVGTGTGVGKTTLSVTMVRLLRERLRVGAWKPVETGGDGDGRALAEAAGADAGPSIVLGQPLAPSVAARMEGRAIVVEDLAREGRRRAALVEVLVVEFPGGLYSPLDSKGATNAELVATLRPDRLILVAANRLGVLHDVEVCRRAMRADGLRLDLVVLCGAGDPSAATNKAELTSSTVLELPTPSATDELVAWLSSVR